MVRNWMMNGWGRPFGSISVQWLRNWWEMFQCSEEFARWLSNQASAANFKSDSVRQVLVFLSLRFMPVRHARFHWTSKFVDNDVFGGFVKRKRLDGLRLSLKGSFCACLQLLTLIVSISYLFYWVKKIWRIFTSCILLAAESVLVEWVEWDNADHVAEVQ